MNRPLRGTKASGLPRFARKDDSNVIAGDAVSATHQMFMANGVVYSALEAAPHLTSPSRGEGIIQIPPAPFGEETFA